MRKGIVLYRAQESSRLNWVPPSPHPSVSPPPSFWVPGGKTHSLEGRGVGTQFRRLDTNSVTHCTVVIPLPCIEVISETKLPKSMGDSVPSKISTKKSAAYDRVKYLRFHLFLTILPGKCFPLQDSQR
jgi:hypothetical protein